MNSLKAYSKLLEDPRWHEKREYVLERDRRRCQHCGVKSMFLDVHHLRYVGLPWESPMEDMISPCRTCHEVEERRKHKARAREFAEQEWERLGLPRISSDKGYMHCSEPLYAVMTGFLVPAFQKPFKQYCARVAKAERSRAFIRRQGNAE